MSDWKSTALLMGTAVAGYIFVVKPGLENAGKAFDDALYALNPFNIVGDITKGAFEAGANVSKNFIGIADVANKNAQLLSKELEKNTLQANLNVPEDTPLPTNILKTSPFIKDNSYFDDNPFVQANVVKEKVTKTSSNNQKAFSQLKAAATKSPENFISGTLLPKTGTSIIGNYSFKSNRSSSSSSKSINTTSAPVSVPKPKVSTGGTFAPSHYAQSAAESARYATIRARSAVLAAKNVRR